MAAQSFSIQPSKDIDPAQLAKKNQRIKAIFNKYKLHGEPQRVVCEKIIIDPNNRDGQPPDMQYLHCNLEPDQEKDGWLETRPKPGILVKLTDPAMRRRAIDHNVKLMEGTEGLYPPLHESLIEYSCLAANHLTLSHRGMKAHMRSCITGKVWGDAGDPAMKTLLAHGHKNLYELLAIIQIPGQMIHLQFWRRSMKRNSSAWSLSIMTPNTLPPRTIHGDSFYLTL